MKKPPKALLTAFERFAKKYAFIRSSDGACGRCLCGSRDFISEFMPRAKLLYLVGSRKKFPRWNIYYREAGHGNPDHSLYHVVVRYGDWVLDVTRRQFQPRCRMPFIQHIDQVRAEWIHVTKRSLF